ncbi:AraC-like DNA-binding protein [Saonia flava]|uniref:AraC-like DNA-binding protein n=1 Tax=Saonia flava TaxID=523696 RepID=A0A846QW36_9FLAO|nr:helix-turn-helix domain-containing protein [Saonia flava]NJB70493.1 AraC-like DNA-binding protein [Saonia flava]
MENTQNIKLYKQSEKLDQSIYFGISRMEDIHEKHKGKADDPHRHDYYTVLLVKRADGKHIIDFKEHPLKQNQVFFIAPGQVHQVIEKNKSYGFSIVFSMQFLIENNISIQFIEDLNLFNFYGNYPPLSLSKEELEKLTHFSEEMIQLYKSSNVKFSTQAIGSYLKLFFIHCNNLCSLSSNEIKHNSPAHTILKKFKNLLNDKHQEWHGTAQYANALNITSDHLNRTIKSLVGNTAKEMIQSRIIIAAKRLIYFTDLSSKEIGYQLGFSEPANFSAFFKNCTGVSPSDFKKTSNIAFS